MPLWLEILLDFIGYAGFVAIATRGRSHIRQDARDQTEEDI